MNIIDWIGASGVFLILLAFFLNLIEQLDSKGLPYLLLNLIGALLACAASVMLNYWPFIILEAAWSLVSFWGIYKYLKSS
ncbi:CBU_0592 family membrane protein [Fulvivirga lutimaris]|uniref:CBU_0592 family membrane protein n=1 Tax=Fulvivirga lutimaris TaxID=1819566 RepID=UPI0012BD384A|nr:hypothetical protein [Fulvivirga lutimaris]MTI41529.1 hypothetical protein [Fulvivirga lutimaris]